MENRNNHPHPAGQGWLVHNGVVHNYAGLAAEYRLPLQTECDSEVLGLILARKSGPLEIRAAHTAALVHGPLALLGLWAQPLRLVSVRRGNPLFFSETKDGFYFGSLPGELPGTAKPHFDNLSCRLTFRKGKLSLDRCAIPPSESLPMWKE